MLGIRIEARVMQLAMLAAAATVAVAISLPPLVKNPAMLQLNTRVVMQELQLRKTSATLDDFPDSEIDSFKEAGFDILHMIGVWQTGMFGLQRSLKTLQEEKVHPEEAATSSPYAIVDYCVHDDFGGDAALSRFRDRVNQRGIRLILDFVPNHMAVDHTWTVDRPELLVQGSEDDLAREPQNFFKVGDKIFAHGRDPYFDGWEDTVQLNYGHSVLRSEMCKILSKIASQCDGIRCDMAMLQCPEILEQTWGGKTAPADGSPEVKEAFWPDAIKVAKTANKGLVMLAEVYWGRDFELQEAGFTFTYDKALYDRIVDKQGDPVRLHLTADLPFQSKCVRYLESHDEERIAVCLSDAGTHEAAAVICATIPGAHSYHDGQLQGRKKMVSLHANCRLEEKRDPTISMIYAKILGVVLRRPEVRDGTWAQCKTASSMDQNPSWQNIVAHCCWDATGHAILVVVNYNGDHSNGHVVLPPQVQLATRSWPIPPTMNYSLPSLDVAQPLEELKGNIMLRDLWSHCVFARDAAELLGQHGGMWFDLKPWQAHVFDLSIL
mmetsp:Transcript_63144/g.131299  ORF Transcript_63144/g.131299 Transcript_63144/m.131299 type:complete len:550 (-) Transcript_63144:271-1920(-)